MKAFYGAVDRIVANDQDVHILVCGDSTCESYNEWGGLFAQWLGERYPTHTVEWEAYWNNGAEDWGDIRTVSTGTGSYTVKLWVAAGSGWGMAEATAAGVLDHPAAVDFVVTYTGINSVTVGEWDTGLAEVQDQWPSAHITVVAQHPFISPYTPPGDWQPAALNQRTRDVARDWGFPLVDAESPLLVGDASGDFDLDVLFPDGIHPSGSGSSEIVGIVEAAFLGGGGVTAIAGKTPELYWDADEHGGSGNLLDQSGNGYNGTISGSVFADWEGRTYCWTPGVAGNSLSVPDSPELDNDGSEYDIRALVANRAGFNPQPGALVSKDNIAGGQRAFYFSVIPGTSISFRATTNAGAIFALKAFISSEFSEYGTDPFWLRVTALADNGSSQYEVKFWRKALGGDTWTQISSTATGTAFANFASSNANVHIGTQANGSTDPKAGPFFAAQVFHEIDGDTPVLDVDLRDASEPFASFTERANGATVTVNRSGSGYLTTLVDRKKFIRSTDDYIETVDHADLDFAADEDFTLFVVVDVPDATPSADQTLIAKKANLTTGAGYALYLDTVNGPTGIIADGAASTEAVGPALTANTRHVIALKRDTTADAITVYTDGVAGTPVTDTTTATLANSEALRTGRLSGASTSYGEGGEYANVVFREALTDAEIRVVGKVLSGAEEPLKLHGQALWAWIQINEAGNYTSTELVGALNELNGTSGVEYAQARGTYLGIAAAG